MQKWVVGVDEVGRGPLAGPVGVGVAMVAADFDWNLIPGVTDSKKLSEAKREDIYKTAYTLRREGVLTWSVAMMSAKQIDERGIQWAIRTAMRRALKNVCLTGSVNRPSSCRLGPEMSEVMVKLDGGLKAPSEFVHQETIVKGDVKEPTIGLASIVAKVTRDRYMRRRASLAAYTPYDFATHKGYGTKAHRAAILEHGLSPEHRTSFCRNIMNTSP